MFPNNPFNITVIKTDAPSTNAEEAQVDQFCEDLQDLLEQIQKKKKCLFHHGDWKAKVGSQGITGKFDLGIQNEAGQKLTEFCQENTLVISNTFSNNPRDDSTCGHHQVANTEIILIIFFAAKEGEALYSQQKQDLELTMVQIMSPLL